jgi:hypothetical protein
MSAAADPFERPTVPAPGFEHLMRLTDEHGLFEHADGTTASTMSRGRW